MNGCIKTVSRCSFFWSYIAISLKWYCLCAKEVPFQALYELYSVCQRGHWEAACLLRLRSVVSRGKQRKKEQREIGSWSSRMVLV